MDVSILPGQRKIKYQRNPSTNHKPQGHHVADGETDDKVDQDDGHEDDEDKEDQLRQPGDFVEFPKFDRSKGHHHNLDERVPQVVKRRLIQEDVKGDGEGEQGNNIWKKKLQNGPGHLEGHEDVLSNPRKDCQHPHELPRRVEYQDTSHFPASYGNRQEAKNWCGWDEI